MLVLSRQEDQRTTITVPPSESATVIEVLVVRVDQNKVRLGFCAAPEVVVMRNELLGLTDEPGPA